MRSRAALVALALARVASAQPPSAPKEQPLDVREAPFPGDWTWLCGSNRQPSSLLTVGVLTFSVYVDTYFLVQWHNPIDHTAFPSVVAPRHNEIGLNLASLGVTLPANAIDTAAGSPVAELDVQYGNNVETVYGQDASTQRGFFLTQRALAPIRVATAGWHFHWLHGAQIEVGIFPSFLGIDSYLTQENWNYLRSFASDFTPYYFSGARLQVFPTRTFKAELWATNGWQTFGQWHEAGGAAFTLTWRPSDRFTATNAGYVSPDVPGDESVLRFYEQTVAQVNLLRRSSGALHTASLAGVLDLGYDTAGRQIAGAGRVGAVAQGRLEWAYGFSTALRADTYWDENQAVTASFPLGSPYVRDTSGSFLGTGLTATLEYLPSPWLMVRAEYMHRAANVPYFSGRNGITGPSGMLPANDAAKASFTPDLRRVDDRAVVALVLRL